MSWRTSFALMWKKNEQSPVPTSVAVSGIIERIGFHNGEFGSAYGLRLEDNPALYWHTCGDFDPEWTRVLALSKPGDRVSFTCVTQDNPVDRRQTHTVFMDYRNASF